MAGRFSQGQADPWASPDQTYIWAEHPCQQSDLIPLSDCLLRRTPEANQHNALATSPQRTKELNAVWFGDPEAEIHTRKGNCDKWPKTLCKNKKKEKGKQQKMSHSPAPSNYGDCVASLRTSLNLLESSVETLGNGVSDFPRLGSVLKTVRVNRSYSPYTPNHRASVHT